MVITWHRYGAELPFRQIRGLPNAEMVQGWGWEVGSTVTMQVLDADGNVVRELGGEPSVPEWDPTVTYVEFRFEDYDLMAGDHIRMTDGHLTRDLWPTGLDATDVDLQSQTVSGIAEPVSAVAAEIFFDPLITAQTVADQDGNWTMTFSDFPRGSYGEAFQEDVDGDQTRDGFGIPNPRIVASEAGDWYWTTDFRGGTLSASVYDSPEPDANLLWSGGKEADEYGFAFFSFEDHGIDLLPGYRLVVSDGVTEKSLVLETITMHTFDTAADFMAGTAVPGRDVWAAAGPQDWQQGMPVLADPVDGAWEADFAAIGFDITEDMRSWSYAQVFDDDGDANEAGAPPLPYMEALILAAQQEGALTVIALPDTWCNYGAIMQAFTDAYGIPVHSVEPEAGSADELQAIRDGIENPGPNTPDVIDVGPGYAVQAQAEGLITPYQVQDWGTIPDTMREAEGYWYGDYYGLMSIAANASFSPLPTSWEALRSGEGYAQVALPGDPTVSNMAFFGVYGASLANGGSVDDIAPGVAYFADLQNTGRLSPVIGSESTLLNGETPILLEWSYLALAQQDANPAVPIQMAASQPPIASYYAQAISATAPHPNAARLWMEYLYSDAGQLAFAEGYCLPARYEEMRSRGVIPEDLLARLPDPSGAAFPTVEQISNAQAFVEANWACMVYGEGCAPAPLQLRVNYGHDWVESFYEPGRTVAITVYEADHSTVRATVPSLATNEAGFFQTQPGDWDAAQPDIQPYDWVYAVADNGQTAEVQLGEILGEIDLPADRIQGTITASWISDPVGVECLDWGSGGGPFNREAEAIHTDGAETYACSWLTESGTDWDIQGWQDVGVGYSGPDGHWVANAFHAETWIAFFTYDPPPGTWTEGAHSYWTSWAFTEPYEGADEGGTTSFVVSPDAPSQPGIVLLRGRGLTAGDGTSCYPVEAADPESFPALPPDQLTRFLWGWLTDIDMTRVEADAHLASMTVNAHWDGANSAQLVQHEIYPSNGIDLPSYVCSYTSLPE